MNTLLSRSNAIFAFTLSVLAVLTIICSMSTAFKDYSKLMQVKITTGQAVVKSVPDYSANREKNDIGILRFNLDADLSKVFDWNTKQVFLYLTARYATRNNADNQVVLWDQIVLRGENPKVALNGQHTKYYFWDDGNGLRGNSNVTLTLSMNVIPNAGFLPITTASSSHVFSFPVEYTK